MRGAYRRAGDPTRLTDAGGGHHVRFDGGFEAIDPDPLLDPPNLLLDALVVDHRVDLLVVAEPALEVVVQRCPRPLADAEDGRAGLGESTRELLLVVRKAGLQEDHVHATVVLDERLVAART